MKLPLDNEDRNTDRNVLQKGDDTALAEETLQALVNNDKGVVDVTHLCPSESIAGKTDEFPKVSLGVACAKSQITCPKPEVLRIGLETLTKSETAKPSIDEKHSNDAILCTENKSASVAGEPAGTEGATTCIEGETMNVEEETKSMKTETTCIENANTRTENETSWSNQNITGSTKETTTKEEIIPSGSKVMCQTDVNTCTSNEVACDTREESSPTRNDTPVSIEMDECDTKPISVAQNNDTVEETTSRSNDDRLTPEKEISRSPDILGAQRSLHQSKSMQGSFRSLIFPEDMRSILSNTNVIPKVPSDFELTPLNVKSELLKPIEIDSDLLVLSDSFMDLSVDDEEVTNGEVSGADDDKEAE